MFERSKLLRQFAHFEADACTPPHLHEVISRMGQVTGLTDKAVELAKKVNDVQFGAAFLAISLTSIAAESKSPQELTSALSDVMSVAATAIERRSKSNPLLAQMMAPWVLEARMHLLNAAIDTEAEANSGSQPPERDATFQITGNMPDVTKSQPTRVFRAGQYLILFLKDVPTVAEEISPNPMQLRFTYVMVAVDSQTSRPKFFVTLEKSIAVANMLCTMDANGGHSSLGVQNALAKDDAFVVEALSRMKGELEIDSIEELGR
jgi:hypothetical protein